MDLCEASLVCSDRKGGAIHHTATCRLVRHSNHLRRLFTANNFRIFIHDGTETCLDRRTGLVRHDIEVNVICTYRDT